MGEIFMTIWHDYQNADVELETVYLSLLCNMGVHNECDVKGCECPCHSETKKEAE